MSSHHLTRSERDVIFQLKTEGQSNAFIAQALGRSQSTISRELRRNADADGRYFASSAQTLANARQRTKIHRHVTGSRMLMKWIWGRLEAKLSPEQIAGQLRRNPPSRLRGKSIHHATIYRWIWADDDRAEALRPHLRIAHKPRRKKYGSPSRRGQIRNRVSIDQRPDVVANRVRLGDWEGDTVIGKAHRGAVVTMVDRASRYLVARVVDDKSAAAVTEAIWHGLHRVRPEQRRTLTVDNGKEFAWHEQIANELRLDVFFADPYCSWQRGTNENTNGLLRQYLPKSSTFTGLTADALARYTRQLNNRPRKCLNYQTPAEVFHNPMLR